MALDVGGDHLVARASFKAGAIEDPSAGLSEPTDDDRAVEGLTLMAPRPRWWHTLQSSKAEVLLAVDLYNRSGNERQLEAFITHMNRGSTNLLQARTDETGGEMIVRDDRGWRKKHPEGGYLYKPLRELLAEQFAATDPRLSNIVFFLGLRNQIEHRHEAKVAALVAGRTQALLINYEQTLVEWFGQEEALGSELRFPCSSRQ